MEAHRLVVGLADGDDRGEVAVLPVLKVCLRPVRPLDPRLDLPVVEKELLDPSGGGGLFPGEGLMLIVDDEVDAALGNLRLHGGEALPVDVELPLRAFDVA